MTENDLLFLFIARVPFVLPDVRVFRRTILRRQEMANGYFVSAGVPGQCDAYALIRGGRVVEIETKSARGVDREAQLAWAAFCRAFEIPHLRLAERKGDAPDVTVDRWVSELGEVIR